MMDHLTTDSNLAKIMITKMENMQPRGTNTEMRLISLNTRHMKHMTATTLRDGNTILFQLTQVLHILEIGCSTDAVLKNLLSRMVLRR